LIIRIIQQRLQILKLLFKQFHPIFCSFFHLRLKSVPHHHTLEHS
jgi:hypothetical protein